MNPSSSGRGIEYDIIGSLVQEADENVIRQQRAVLRSTSHPNLKVISSTSHRPECYQHDALSAWQFVDREIATHEMEVLYVRRQHEVQIVDRLRTAIDDLQASAVLAFVVAEIDADADWASTDG
jgi:hypothetical protein